ncbi:TadE-like protein [mine drainage metagenome]|uniref:TadE-like protein n=1 Tax=mine drainage metagenome TaxID=410659 RepID=A0A1J5RNS4_9ZZZZ
MFRFDFGRSVLRRLWRDCRGVSAVEFALVAPVLVTMLLGVGDYGHGFTCLIQLRNAVQAGASYCMHNGAGACTQSAVAGVVAAATPLAVPSGNVALTLTYGCTTGSGITYQSADTPNCSGGVTPGEYAEISASYDYVTTLGGVSIPLTSQTEVRLQ